VRSKHVAVLTLYKMFLRSTVICLLLSLKHRGMHTVSIVVAVLIEYIQFYDRLCGLVVRVSGYRYRGPGFDSRRYQIF
jgi:hypothetical protein